MVQPLDDAFRTLYPDTVQHTYGLGWSIWDYRGGHRVVSHSGSIGGFRAQVALLPDVKAGVAVLCNMQSHVPEIVRNAVFRSSARFARARLDRRLRRAVGEKRGRGGQTTGGKAAKRHSRTRPSRPLDAYAGAYEEPAYGTATVTHDMAALDPGLERLSAPPAPSSLRRFCHRQQVRRGDIAFDDQDVLFALDKHGEVATLTLFDEITFRKTKPKNDSVENA
jgi:hypothetical protein